MKILIVDDDLISTRILLSFLKPLGQVDVALKGSEALTKFRESLDAHLPYDLGCFDIMMPEMSGQQLLEEVRRLEKTLGKKESEKLKIIITTVLDDSRERATAFKNGCQAYLVKPIIKEQLLQEIKKCGLAS